MWRDQKQGNKMSSGGRGWRRQKGERGGGGQVLKKWVGNIGGLHRIGGLGPLCQL